MLDVFCNIDFLSVLYEEVPQEAMPEGDYVADATADALRPRSAWLTRCAIKLPLAA
jgi:hypothetical protein